MRLDETSEHTRHVLEQVYRVDVQMIINKGASVDVCRACYLKLEDNHGVEDDVDHPNYDEDRYTCRICGVKLNQWRDG